MNSKKKNKNRQNKATNLSPPAKEEVIEILTPVDVTNPIGSVVEERVPNIVSENVTAEPNKTEEIPKKPTRNKGKKKREDVKTDKEDEVKADEPLPDPEVQAIKDTFDESNIAPTARKKKHKNKKSQALSQEDKKEESKIDNDPEIVETSVLAPEESVVPKEDLEQDTKSTKKKNKKKKNRNDSEKDKAEDISCTSAFQELLTEDVKLENIAQPSVENSSILEAKELGIRPQSSKSSDSKTNESLQKDEFNKNKKKNKKDKMQTAIPAIPISEEQTTKSIEIIPAEILEIATVPTSITQDASEPLVEEAPEYDEVAIPSSSNADDNSLKHKAKTGKPVDKKKKAHVNLEKPVSTPKSENAGDVKVTEIECTQQTAMGDVLPPDDVDDLVLVPLTEINPDWQEEVNIKEGNGPIIGCEDKNEATILERPTHSHEKNKKKSPKPPRSSEMSGQPDTTKSESTLEETYTQQPSSSAIQMQAVKRDLKPDEKQEDKPQQHDETMKNIQVREGTEKRDKIKMKEANKPATFKGQSGTPILDEVIPEIVSKSAEPQKILFEKKQDNKEEMIPEATRQIQVDDKRNRNKKSQRARHEPRTSSEAESVQTELTQISEITLPDAINSPNINTTKSENINPDLETDKTEVKKEEVEQIKTPEGETCQRRKKTLKPVQLEVATSSKSDQNSNKNALNIEDIIIIQAEVVSGKGNKSEECISCEDNSDKKERKRDVTHESEKSKKSKKSPKPPQQDRTQEPKVETQGEIQTPVTPMPQDIKISTENPAIELEPAKIDSVLSPNEITPDFIEYPRCSSEHLDSNNNMIIQEISHPDPHLEVSKDIHEIPILQSENISSSESESKNEEKTDLKSKVMEVSQDMEGLKLSIERSLAELSSLDKTDRDTEKKIEESLIHIKKIEVKQEIHSEESQPESTQNVNLMDENQAKEEKSCQGPVCPARKDPKGKGKSKKKGKQESTPQNTSTQPSATTTSTEISTQPQEKIKENNKSEQSSAATQSEEKQKSGTKESNDADISVNDNHEKANQPEFVPIEHFEDAMTSSVDDVNKSFEMIANESNPRLNGTQNNPEINVIEPQEDEKENPQEKQNPVSPPKNLLGHPDIPVPSSRTDYKKEKNKPPNCRQAKVKIKDANQAKIETIEKSKESSESNRKLLKFTKPDESICVTNQNDDYVYKYSFRKVFLQCYCHVCKKDLNETRVPCSYCNLIFYCSQKHKDEDYSQHQALCFAVSTIIHLKDQNFIYADSRNVTGHNYRLLRMQMIVSCEKVLKRRLTAWEQEALLYPRMCADASCREWRQGKLADCEGCGQISYCSEHPEHLPKSHSRWCKSYNLYRGLVKHQQTKGRLEPKLPTRVLDLNPLPDNINEVLAAMYEEKIEMNDVEYAALTQLATAPLTALFCLQFRTNTNGIAKKLSLTVHVVGAELQFEADVLNKWEVFLLHLVPHVEELKVVLVGPDLNPSNLPLELLGKIKHCNLCQKNRRRVVFGFQDKRTYHEFWASEDFTTPDLVCAFNPSIQRSSAYNGKDTWPATINCIFKLKVPLVVTSYTLSELTSDLLRIQECATVSYNVVCAPKNNSFSSVRPDRNFISDDEAPLLFKNHCVTVVCGV